MKFFLAFSFLFINFVCLAQTETTINWKEKRSLSWDDFRANAEEASDAVALTASGISFGYSITESSTKIISFKATAEAHFYPHKSWYKILKADDYILSHEQLHFDITELHSRKFRRDISQLSVSAQIKNKLEKLHTKHLANLSAMQNAYDKETKHSINKTEQQRWHLFIQAELEKLSYYK